MPIQQPSQHTVNLWGQQTVGICWYMLTTRWRLSAIVQTLNVSDEFSVCARVCALLRCTTTTLASETISIDHQLLIDQFLRSAAVAQSVLVDDDGRAGRFAAIKIHLLVREISMRL